MMKYQMKKLKAGIIETLSDINSEDINEYMISMKSILYFIGKATLAISMYRDINEESKYIEIIDNSLINKLPEIFIDFDSQFEYQNYLSEHKKKELIKVLFEIDREMIRNFSIGELYQELITSRERKYLGQVYTPHYIIKHMISSGISKEDIIKNPYFKVIDPACGGGYFLIEAYDRIKYIFENNYEEIMSMHKEIKAELEQGLHLFILKHNIWGADIDSFAVYMTIASLLMKEVFYTDVKVNIYTKDILMEGRGNLLDLKSFEEDIIFNEDSFDLVIGNPPYIGHKKIDKDYRKKLNENYLDIYYDKSDISYCFFMKGYELLRDNGKLTYITSRYFQEAPSALGLRRFIKENLIIDSIIDFYGRNVFKGIGISPVIIECTKKKKENSLFNVYKLQDNIEYEDDIIDNILKSSDRLLICQDSLENSGWFFINNVEKKLFNKIDGLGEYRLDELCICNQGIITGCDKAFIVDKNMITEEGLETDIIKPWIKNSQVKKFKPPVASKYILYTDEIDDTNSYKNIINHITPFKNKLNDRRECKKGTREWYKLQWGRDIQIFNGPKILFPFKSSMNQFTLSYDAMCCSADVYIINSKENSSEHISLKYLLGYLNSSIFEFYFKSVAKKLNEQMYEYYPNKLMNLRIRIGEDIHRKIVEELVTSVISNYIELDRLEANECGNRDYIYIQKIAKDIKEKINEINNTFYRLYELSDEEITIIESKIMNGTFL